MKTKHTLLALCLLGAGTAFGQTNSSYSSTSATTTYNADSSKAVTPTKNGDANNATDMSTTNGSTSTAGQTTNGTSTNGTYSSGNTNSVAPVNSTYSTSTTTTDYNTTAPARAKKGYQGLVVGIYAGLNTTKFKGESINTSGNSALTGRLGYQGGIFIRGGGRVYGQIGAEYFASSSNYFTAGSGQSASSISGQIDIKYIQVPVYIGYKLTQSDRGISAVRVQVGVEYANQIGSTANQFGNLSNFQVKSGTFNGLGQLGFDAGPVFLDLTYHYGFSGAITENQGFAGSARRILSASVGFKF